MSRRSLHWHPFRANRENSFRGKHMFPKAITDWNEWAVPPVIPFSPNRENSFWEKQTFVKKKKIRSVSKKLKPIPYIFIIPVLSSSNSRKTCQAWDLHCKLATEQKWGSGNIADNLWAHTSWAEKRFYKKNFKKFQVRWNYKEKHLQIPWDLFRRQEKSLIWQLICKNWADKRKSDKPIFFRKKIQSQTCWKIRSDRDSNLLTSGFKSNSVSSRPIAEETWNLLRFNNKAGWKLVRKGEKSLFFLNWENHKSAISRTLKELFGGRIATLLSNWQDSVLALRKRKSSLGIFV